MRAIVNLKDTASAGAGNTDERLTTNIEPGCHMAARKFTGSARIRAAQSKSSSLKLSAELADIAARLGEVRAVLAAAIDSLRGQNHRIDADIAANLKRFASTPLYALIERLVQLSKQSA
jgi:hypothetical protein